MRLVLAVAAIALAFPAMAQFKDGRYRIEAEMSGMPGMPPGMGKQVREQCFSKKDAADPLAAMQQEPGCKVLKSTKSGDRFSADVACSDMTMQMEYRTTQGGFEGETRMQMTEGGQKHSMTVKSKGTRLGDC
jgi:hypothetical protein